MPDPMRSLASKVAAHTRWAQTPDRAAAMAKAWAARDARFAKQVDPDGTLPPAVRAQLAESARRAFYASLALKSAQARRARSRKTLALAEEQAAAEAALAELEDGAA